MDLAGQDVRFCIRPAEKKDCAEIRKLIQELAEFEKMPNAPKINAERLEKDGFDTDPPLFGCFVAEDKNKVDKESSKIVGYALYFYGYSTWTARKLHLEDLYVSEKYRNKNIGSMLFREVAKKVVADGCSYMDLDMLSWNPAKSFYEARGCVNITETEQWNSLRLEGTALLKVIQSQDRLNN